MAVGEIEKEFVIRHTFKNVMNMKEGDELDGPIETHFNVPWKICIQHDGDELNVYLDCMLPTKNKKWSIDSYTIGNVIIGNDDSSYKYEQEVTFDKETPFERFTLFYWNKLPGLLVNGNLTYEFTVIIDKAIGVRLEAPRPRIFHDEAAREDSDVTLVVGDQKFHVIKLYLAAHSTYFKALFLGNFSETQKSEIELKEIDPNDFQLFLKLIYGETSVEDSSVLKILHLADFFDSKTAIGRCEAFLVENSNLSLKEKFDAVTKYNLEELKWVCISQLKTYADFLSIVPENSSQFDRAFWKKLKSEKKFVIRHSFENVENMKDGEKMDGPIETHFNIPWKIRIRDDGDKLKVFLDCMLSTKNKELSIDTKTTGHVIDENGDLSCKYAQPVTFDKENTLHWFTYCGWEDVSEFLVDGSFTYQFTVIIKKAIGVRLEAHRSRKFDDDAARETSDVTLVVGDQKFHVIKLYLAAHSSYFKSLFLGNFSEAQQSEIELKDIDPNDFQLFLELIYGETSVEDSSVLKILHLADFFDSKTTIGRCETFLVEHSNLSLKEKFVAVTKYKLDELKRDCFAQLETHDDILSIVPEDPSQFDYALWKELLVKSSSLEE